jgi:hypothetical protein
MTIFWIVAIIITLSAAVYQRLTGPTHPQRMELKVDNNVYKIKLVRSHGGNDNCPLKFNIADSSVYGEVMYKRYPTNDEWQTVNLIRKGELLTAELPHQQPAGKLE